MKNILLMVAVCCVPLMAGCSRQAATPLSRAEQHFRQSEWDETIWICDEAIHKDPKNWEVYVLRGRAYLGKDDPQQAIADYTSAIKLAPKESDPLYHRNIAYKQIGELAKAKVDKAQARKLDPLYPSAHLNTYTSSGPLLPVLPDESGGSRIITSKPKKKSTPPVKKQPETGNRDNAIGSYLPMPNTNTGDLLRSVQTLDPRDVINRNSSPDDPAAGNSSGLLDDWLAKQPGSPADKIMPDENLMPDAPAGYPELKRSRPDPRGPLQGEPRQLRPRRPGGAYTSRPPMPYPPGGSPLGMPGAMLPWADPRIASPYAQLPSSGLNAPSQQRTVYRSFDPFAGRRPRLSTTAGPLGSGRGPYTGRTIMSPPTWQYRVPYPQQARPTGIESDRGY